MSNTSAHICDDKKMVAKRCFQTRCQKRLLNLQKNCQNHLSFQKRIQNHLKN